MSVDVGSKAPDFTLIEPGSAAGHARAQQRGKPVVLAFFPAAFSWVCTKELCTFRDSLAQLNAAQAQVYGISVDTFFTLKAFQDQQKLTFPLLSDFNKEVIRDYGVFNEDMIGLKGIAKRAVFVHRQGRAWSGTARCWRTPGTSRTTRRCSGGSLRSALRAAGRPRFDPTRTGSDMLNI